jgi:hypothetical protein
MTELEKVKEQARKDLIGQGYTVEQAQKAVDRFQKVTGYYNGKPSRVKTTDGIEIFL